MEQQQEVKAEIDAPRIIAFIEKFDKQLEAAGYTHLQRLEIVGILMGTHVAKPAEQK